jgi:hypothetical protein
MYILSARIGGHPQNRTYESFVVLAHNLTELATGFSVVLPTRVELSRILVVFANRSANKSRVLWMPAGRVKVRTGDHVHSDDNKRSFVLKAVIYWNGLILLDFKPLYA